MFKTPKECIKTSFHKVNQETECQKSQERWIHIDILCALCPCVLHSDSVCGFMNSVWLLCWHCKNWLLARCVCVCVCVFVQFAIWICFFVHVFCAYITTLLWETHLDLTHMQLCYCKKGKYTMNHIQTLLIVWQWSTDTWKLCIFCLRLHPLSCFWMKQWRTEYIMQKRQRSEQQCCHQGRHERKKKRVAWSGHFVHKGPKK